MKLRLLLAITGGMMMCLFVNLSHAQPEKILNVPDFVISVPLGHFAGISPPVTSIDQARKLAVLDVVRQVLSAIGIEYHHSLSAITINDGQVFKLNDVGMEWS